MKARRGKKVDAQAVNTGTPQAKASKNNAFLNMATDTKELKSLLHESIENIDDEDLLRIVKGILDRKYEPAETVTLHAYQKKRIEKAKKSIEKGDYLTNEQADELVTTWLSE